MLSKQKINSLMSRIEILEKEIERKLKGKKMAKTLDRQCALMLLDFCTLLKLFAEELDLQKQASTSFRRQAEPIIQRHTTYGNEYYGENSDS